MSRRMGCVNPGDPAERAGLVGVVGVGDMGNGIARSLLRGGFDVVVYDVRPEAVDSMVRIGASAATSVAELVTRVATVLIVVVDDAQVREVVGQALAAPGRVTSTLIVQSTVLPSTITEVVDAASAHGVAVIDAAVTGGKEKGASGTLTVLIGGSEGAVRANWALFEAIGSNLFHVGPSGAGVVAKLINNVLSLGGHALQLEAMQLGAAYGLDEDAITEFVAVGTGDSRGMRTWGRFERIRAEHTMGGTDAVYEHFSKDLREAAVAGGQQGVSLPLIAAAGDLLPRKMAQRDQALQTALRRPEVPRCTVCGHELAKPFRQRGRHPECERLEP
jgi:3-hydroxyisobutyrate dehydrogenase-like beta-hydroxyacid dehydrogenase